MICEIKENLFDVFYLLTLQVLLETMLKYLNLLGSYIKKMSSMLLIVNVSMIQKPKIENY